MHDLRRMLTLDRTTGARHPRAGGTTAVTWIKQEQMRFRRRTAVFAGVLTLAGGMALSAAVPASASWGNYQLGSQGTGLCLYSNSAGSVYTRQCGASNPYQYWSYQYVTTVSGENVVKIYDGATGLCLTTDWNKDLFAMACNQDGQEFYQLVHTGLVDEYQNTATGLCVDGNNGYAYTNPCGWDNPYQQ